MKIHLCGCRINLAGQNCHIVNYDKFNPLSWPEVQVLQQLHGDENVMDIVPVSIGEATPGREKERLVAMYGSRVVETCFPGRNFRMQLLMTGDEDLSPYIEGEPAGRSETSRSEPSAELQRNGDGDDDPDEVRRNLAAATAEPVFKPSRHARPTEA